MRTSADVDVGLDVAAASPGRHRLRNLSSTAARAALLVGPAVDRLLTADGRQRPDWRRMLRHSLRRLLGSFATVPSGFLGGVDPLHLEIALPDGEIASGIAAVEAYLAAVASAGEARR